MFAPDFTCSNASLITVSKFPFSNSKANFFLPVGFILSPIMQNGSSSPIVTVFDELSTIVFVI